MADDIDVLNPTPVGATPPQKDFYSRALTSYRGGTLKKGARGKTVRALQLFLRDQGHDIKADGVWGKNTDAAFRAWQESEGLSVDGKAGQRQTFSRIRETVTPRPRTRPEPVEMGPAEAITTAGMSTEVEAPEIPVAAPEMPPAAPPQPPMPSTRTARSDMTPEQMDRMRQMRGIGPFPVREEFPGRLPAMEEAAYADESRDFDVPGPQTRMAELQGQQPQMFPAPPSPMTPEVGNLSEDSFTPDDRMMMQARNDPTWGEDIAPFGVEPPAEAVLPEPPVGDRFSGAFDAGGPGVIADLATIFRQRQGQQPMTPRERMMRALMARQGGY